MVTKDNIKLEQLTINGKNMIRASLSYHVETIRENPTDDQFIKDFLWDIIIKSVRRYESQIKNARNRGMITSSSLTSNKVNRNIMQSTTIVNSYFKLKYFIFILHIACKMYYISIIRMFNHNI